MINLEAKEPVINELMVEIPMFSLCDVRALKLALTACLSSPQLASLRGKKKKEKRGLINARQCVCTCVDMEEVGTPQEDFRFFMVRTCCEKKKGARQNTFIYTCVPERVHQGHIYITGCCIILLNTFPARNRLLSFLYVAA